MIQLKYFSRKKQKIQTSANTENFINLQANTKYINYFNAKNFHSKKKLENKFAPCKKRLIKNLTQIIDFSKKHKIEILLINNINYKGVNDDWLYYTNSIISDFAEKYSLSFIDLLGFNHNASASLILVDSSASLIRLRGKLIY